MTEDAGRAVYYLFGKIDESEAAQFCSSLGTAARELADQPGSRITLFINSEGGSFSDGMAMMAMVDRVRREGIPVDAVVLGYAYSMAAVLFQAGDRRSMGPFSIMMLRSPIWEADGPAGEILQGMKKLAGVYRHVVGELFCRRTGLHSPQWWERFIYSRKDRYLSAKECLDLRLADEVHEFSPRPIAAVGKARNGLRRKRPHARPWSMSAAFALGKEVQGRRGM